MQNFNELIDLFSIIPSEYHLIVILCLFMYYMRKLDKQPVAETIIIGDVHIHDSSASKTDTNQE